jgi:2-oxoglutarate dehydrogenase E2 component (dihydrolipoamide succinyltransferase)
VRSSPVVQKIAAEHGVDVSLVEGTGEGGRVTKKDIMSYIASASAAAIPAAPVEAPAPAKAAPRPAAPAATARAQVFAAGQDEVREPMSIMRRKIAEHMVMSKHTSAHVYTIFEVDMKNRPRDALKREFDRRSQAHLPSFFISVHPGIRSSYHQLERRRRYHRLRETST